jgi:hypothetical protein
MSVTPLSSSNSTLKVMNAALAQIGVPEIASFNDDGLAARSGNLIFSDVLENSLAAYPWRFARDRIRLNASTKPAPAPWEYVYDIPTSAIAVLSVWVDGQSQPFDRFGSVIATNSNTDVEVYADVTKMTTPDKWPGYFRRAFTMELAAALAIPITQDAATAGAFKQMAEEMMLKARSRDAQGRTSSRLDTKLFIRARRTNRGL